MLFTDLKTQNSGTTSGCAVRHTASMPSSCSEQSELIPGPMCESIAYGSVMLDLGSVCRDTQTTGLIPGPIRHSRVVNEVKYPRYRTWDQSISAGKTREALV